MLVISLSRVTTAWRLLGLGILTLTGRSFRRWVSGSRLEQAELYHSAGPISRWVDLVSRLREGGGVSQVGYLSAGVFVSQFPKTPNSPLTSAS